MTPGATPIGSVVSVNVGQARQFQWRGKPRTSSIWKHPVQGRVAVVGNNLEGDAQSDPRFHGGPRKAVYAYAREDYIWWEAQLGRPLEPGAFGENLTLNGVPVSESLVGERWKIGSCIFQVTQPRTPCWKIGVRMQDPAFPKRFAAAARTGAYLSVVEAGDVGQGDGVEIVHRPSHPITVGLLAKLNPTNRQTSELLLQAATQLNLTQAGWQSLLAGKEVSADEVIRETSAESLNLAPGPNAFADEPMEG